MIPGKSEHLVVADSHEHKEDGHVTEDADLRIAMVQKRMKKGKLLEAAVVPPEYVGDDKPDWLLVGWGSTQGSLMEAAAELRRQGTKAGALHFSQVWPLLPEQFLDRIKSAAQIVTVEGNATGQFAQLLKLTAGITPHHQVLKFDGRQITPAYILRALGRGEKQEHD